MLRIAKNIGLISVPLLIVVGLGFLIILEITGVLNARNFAIAALAILLTSVVAWTALASQANRSGSASSATAASVTTISARSQYLRVTLILLLLLVGFWMTRGAPWGPRLVGASVLLLFLSATLIPRKRTH